jgi:hypothetical protein
LSELVVTCAEGSPATVSAAQADEKTGDDALPADGDSRGGSDGICLILTCLVFLI